MTWRIGRASWGILSLCGLPGKGSPIGWQKLQPEERSNRTRRFKQVMETGEIVQS